MKTTAVSSFFLLACLFLGACSNECDCPFKAKAILEPVDNSGVRGIVTFTQEQTGMRIVGEFSGLTHGEHGLHIHEYGDCGGKGAEKAGGHFNPYNDPHGGPYDSPGHVGDLGNVRANLNGNARFERMDYVITLEGSDSVLGKAVVIKKFRDDYLSQPSGNTGPGVACGLIVPID